MGEEEFRSEASGRAFDEARRRPPPTPPAAPPPAVADFFTEWQSEEAVPVGGPW